MKPFINTDTVNAVKDALTPLAEKLGQGAGHIYMVFVKQVLIMGLIEVVYGLLMIALAVAIGYFVSKQVKWGMNQYDDGFDMMAGISTLVVGIVGFIMVVAIAVPALGHLSRGSIMAANPEYFAMQDIIDRVRGEGNGTK